MEIKLTLQAAGRPNHILLLGYIYTYEINIQWKGLRGWEGKFAKVLLPNSNADG
jgi:hypothetical protein